MNIIEHAERFLGPLDSGWAVDGPFGRLIAARFPDQPAQGVDTFVTFGLSHEALSMPGGDAIRQELVFCCREGEQSDAASYLLLRMADLVATRREAPLRGEIMGPGKPIFPGSPMNALYVSKPVIYPDGFAIFDGSVPVTALVWLIPIHQEEASYVKEHGWSPFEDLLEREDPDLWDMARRPVPCSLQTAARSSGNP